MTLPRVLILAAIAGASLAAGAAEPFLRIAGTYNHFHNGGFTDRSGFELAAGTGLGDRGQHELALSFGSVAWDFQHFIPGDVIIQVVGAYNAEEADGHLRPLLAGYRYQFGAPESRLRWYVGAVAGLAQVEGDWYRYVRGSRPLAQTAGFDEWRPAFGGGVGVTFAMGPRASLELGYRYLAVRGFDTDLRLPPNVSAVPGPVKLPVPELRTSSLVLGFSYRF